MSQAEDPDRLLGKRAPTGVTVEDVRRLMGASTPTSRSSCATGSPT